MQPLTLEYSQCSSKCKKTFHMLRGFGAIAKRKKFEKTTAASWINARNGYYSHWVVTQESWDALIAKNPENLQRCKAFVTGISSVFKDPDFKFDCVC